MINRKLPSFETLAKKLSSVTENKITALQLRVFADEKGLGIFDNPMSINPSLKGYSGKYSDDPFNMKGFGATFYMQDSTAGKVMAQRIYYDGPYSSEKRGKIVREALEAVLILAENPDAGNCVSGDLIMSLNVF